MNGKSALFMMMCITGFSTPSYASQPPVHPGYTVHPKTLTGLNTSDGYIMTKIPTEFGVSIPEMTQLAAAIDRVQFARTVHVIGIMGLGICLAWWGGKRFYNSTSKTWPDFFTNLGLVFSGAALTITAPLIAAYIQKYASLV